MNDETEHPGASGNRWEPGAPTPESTPEPTPESTPEPTPEPTAESASRWPWLSRARTATAGAAAAVLLVGGAGGFALGRTTADDGVDGRTDHQQGVPTGFDRDGDRGVPGGPMGQLPGGQLPDGQQPDGDDGGDTSNT